MPYTIRLEGQQQVFHAEADETVLAAALRQGCLLPYGCQNGLCTACKAKVVSGHIHYPGTIPEALTEADRKAGFALLCQARAGSDLVLQARTVTEAAKTETRQLPCRVSACDRLSDDVIRLVLALPKTERLSFSAGQYVDILMHDGQRRSFSLANPPHEDRELELHVRHYDGGLFSDYAFNELKEKTILRIEGPFGQFTLAESDRPMILIAGGTGFAPIKSLVQAALHNGGHRLTYLYWGARTKTGLYLDVLARQWATDFSHLHYIPVLSGVTPADNWTGRTGLVHEAVLADHADLSGFDVYACGPPPMIRAIGDAFPAHGLLKERFFSDAFEFAAQ